MSRRSRRGTGHLYKRKHVWWFKWFDVEGKPQYRSSGARDPQGAASMLREQLAQRDQGLPVLPDPRRVSVDMILDGLMIEYQTNGASQR